MKTHTESGFSIIESLLVVVALGLIGFAGNYVYQTNKTVDTLNSKTAVQNITPKAVVTPTLTTPSVTTASDLTTASTTLDQTDPTTGSSSDVAELDAELASF